MLPVAAAGARLGFLERDTERDHLPMAPLKQGASLRPGGQGPLKKTGRARRLAATPSQRHRPPASVLWPCRFVAGLPAARRRADDPPALPRAGEFAGAARQVA